MQARMPARDRRRSHSTPIRLRRPGANVRTRRNTTDSKSHRVRRTSTNFHRFSNALKGLSTSGNAPGTANAPGVPKTPESRVLVAATNREEQPGAGSQRRVGRISVRLVDSRTAQRNTKRVPNSFQSTVNTEKVYCGAVRWFRFRAKSGKRHPAQTAARSTRADLIQTGET